MRANTKGTLYVKQDRCLKRIDEFADHFLKLEKNANGISKEDFKDFVKSVQLILATELNEKGVERKWKA